MAFHYDPLSAQRSPPLHQPYQGGLRYPDDPPHEMNDYAYQTGPRAPASPLADDDKHTSRVSTSAVSNGGVAVLPRWKQHFWYFAFWVFTVGWILAVVFYSFLSSSSKRPITIFQRPEHTILVLNVGSSISVFLLTELLYGAANFLRWTMAARRNGVSTATFLSLGRSTGIWGVLGLLFANQGFGHRKWALQRYHPSFCLANLVFSSLYRKS